MHLFSVFILLGSACSVLAELSAGQRISLTALKSIVERQIQLCTPVPPPYTCEHSCGPGNIECISFPTCYNPSAGETCCSDGNYCSKGYFCTDAGCCPDGTSLAECGAAFTLSIIPPPTGSPSSPSPSSTSSAVTTSSSSGSSLTPSPSSSTPTPTTPANPTTPSASESPSPTKASPTTTPKITTPSSNSTSASTPAVSTIQPGAAGKTFSFSVIHVALGWFGVLILVL
ncbi:Prp 4 [Hyaloscypha sp. PMI_1271]|nr:Prp 4 [Hyaloscypha sp. PMI_1271]